MLSFAGLREATWGRGGDLAKEAARMPDAEWALVVKTSESTLRLFPMHRPEAVKVSMAELLVNSEDLPPQVCARAASRLRTRCEDLGLQPPTQLTKISSPHVQMSEPSGPEVWWDYDAVVIAQRATSKHSHVNPPARAPIHTICVAPNPFCVQSQLVQIPLRDAADIRRVSTWLGGKGKTVLSSYQELCVWRGLLHACDKLALSPQDPACQAIVPHAHKLSHLAPRRQDVSTMLCDRPQLLAFSKLSSATSSLLDAYRDLLDKIDARDKRPWTGRDATQYAWKLSEVEHALGLHSPVRAFEAFFEPRQKTSGPEPGDVVYSRGVMMVLREDLLRLQSANLAGLDMHLSDDLVQKLKANPVETFVDLPPVLKDMVANFVYDNLRSSSPRAMMR